MSGQTYALLASTNVTKALTQWTSIVTNTFAGGSFSFTIPVSLNAMQQFYVLQVQ